MDKKDNNIGLILSGGGANGAFQVGAMRELIDNGHEFSHVAGVSVGAINAAMYAQGEFDTLERMWESINSKDIYKGSLNLWHIAKALVMGRPNVLSNEPLEKLLNNFLDIRKLKKPLAVGVVNATTGEYEVHRFSPTSHQDQWRYVRAVLASTVIPFVWEPVGMVIGGVEYLYIDGGVRNNMPSRDLDAYGLDSFVAISCNTNDIGKDSGFEKNLISVAKRVFGILLNENFREDDLNLPPNTMLVKPDRPLGDRMDFSHYENLNRYIKGREEARRKIEEQPK